MHALTRRVAAAIAVTGALAIAAPIAGAGAATTPGLAPNFSLANLASYFQGVPLSFEFPAFTGGTFAKGPTVVNDVFNGATVVQVVNWGPADSSVIASP